jgi:hypothetical protein
MGTSIKMVSQGLRLIKLLCCELAELPAYLRKITLAFEFRPPRRELGRARTLTGFGELSRTVPGLRAKNLKSFVLSRICAIFIPFN